MLVPIWCNQYGYIFEVIGGKPLVFVLVTISSVEEL
jgi:hypothetical protein